MIENEINLKEIIFKHTNGVFNKDIVETYIIPIVKEACEKSIDLCAKNADYGDEFDPSRKLLEQSIFNVKNLIK